MINTNTVQYSQNVAESQQNPGDFNYKLDCKKPVDRYAFAQAQRFEEGLRKSRKVTYRGLKRASGRAKRKLING